MMILFFAIVTVIVPAMVLTGVAILAARDAGEVRSSEPPRDKQPSDDWPA